MQFNLSLYASGLVYKLVLNIRTKDGFREGIEVGKTEGVYIYAGR